MDDVAGEDAMTSIAQDADDGAFACGTFPDVMRQDAEPQGRINAARRRWVEIQPTLGERMLDAEHLRVLPTERRAVERDVAQLRAGDLPA